MKKTMKKVFLLATYSATCSILLSACGHYNNHHHWGYSGDGAPDNWGKLAAEYSTCASGVTQSPVNLNTNDKSIKQTNNNVDIKYNPANFILENNGHTIQLNTKADDSKILFDKKEYSLKQFHFHTPAEHTFNKKEYPMEVHFVNISDDKKLSVIGVMFEEGAKNEQIDKILSENIKSGDKKDLATIIDINKLLPKNKSAIYLKGSLTTPPCTEGVNWIVMKNTIFASKEQLNAMEKMIGMKNNRPIQELAGREVLFNKIK